jgi:hypothetical protein
MRLEVVAGLALSALVACSEDGSTDWENAAGSGGVPPVSGAAGKAGGAAAGTAGSSGGTSAGMGGSGTGGMGNANECGVQGEFTAAADMKIQENVCNTLGSFKTTYAVNIGATRIILVQPIEMLPMTGSIDAACQAHIVLESPDYREFTLTFDLQTLQATGTHVDALANGCRTTYDATLVLTRK